MSINVEGPLWNLVLTAAMLVLAALTAREAFKGRDPYLGFFAGVTLVSATSGVSLNGRPISSAMGAAAVVVAWVLMRQAKKKPYSSFPSPNAGGGGS